MYTKVDNAYSTGRKKRLHPSHALRFPAMQDGEVHAVICSAVYSGGFSVCTNTLKKVFGLC